MRYAFVLQDCTNFKTSQNFDCKMFKMRWKWSVCVLMEHCVFKTAPALWLRNPGNKDNNIFYDIVLQNKDNS